jgi:hypothetical protein
MTGSTFNTGKPVLKEVNARFPQCAKDQILKSLWRDGEIPSIDWVRSRRPSPIVGKVEDAHVGSGCPNLHACHSVFARRFLGLAVKEEMEHVSVSLGGDGRQNEGKTPEMTACLQDNAVGQFVLTEESVNHLDDRFVRPMDRWDGDHDHLLPGGAMSRGLPDPGSSTLGPGGGSGHTTRHHMLGADDSLGGGRRESLGHLDKARLSGSGSPRFLSRGGVEEGQRQPKRPWRSWGEDWGWWRGVVASYGC